VTARACASWRTDLDSDRIAVEHNEIDIVAVSLYRVELLSRTSFS